MKKLFPPTGVDPNPAQNQANLRAVDRGWPVAVDLATIQQMTWRVRKWEVSAGSFEYHGISQFGAIHYQWNVSWPAFSIVPKRATVPFDPDNPVRDVTAEPDLLGQNPNQPFTLRNEGVQGGLPSDEVTADLIPNTDNGIPSTDDPAATVSGSMLGSIIIFDPDTQLFYPPATGFFGFAAENTGLHELEVYPLSTDPIADPLTAPTINGGTREDVPQGTLTIVCPWGTNLVIPIGMFGHASPGSVPDGSGSAEVIVTPVKWWQYRNSLGQDVYDEDTGATIANPFA